MHAQYKNGITVEDESHHSHFLKASLSLSSLWHQEISLLLLSNVILVSEVPNSYKEIYFTVIEFVTDYCIPMTFINKTAKDVSFVVLSQHVAKVTEKIAATLAADPRKSRFDISQATTNTHKYTFIIKYTCMDIVEGMINTYILLISIKSAQEFYECEYNTKDTYTTRIVLR